MTAARVRALSVAELQGALDAAMRGEFSVAGRGETPADRGEAPESGTSLGPLRGGRPAIKPGERRATRLGMLGEPAPSRLTDPARGVAVAAECLPGVAGRAVVVLAAHAGAGASTVAVLLGDAAVASGTRTRLIDCADPSRSGVAAATDAELGEDAFGWRRGRRGPLEVLRPARNVGDVEDVPAQRPGQVTVSDRELSIVDAGWPAWDILATDSWVTALLSTAPVVLVCRTTVPGVRQAERLLADLPGPTPVVAAIGPARWPGVVTASCGPRLRAARDADRIVSVPPVRELEVSGLTAGPLPRQLTRAGRALADQILAARVAPSPRRAG